MKRRGFKLTVPTLCRAHGLPAPVPEHQFALPRRFAFDWAWPAAKVALEIEGGLFGIGKPCPVCRRRKVAGHSSVERIKTDVEKYNLAALAGWRVIRALPEQVESGEVMATLRQALNPPE